MQRKSRGLFYITLCLLISSFNIFASASAANNNKKATEPKLSVAEAAAAIGFRSIDTWPEPEQLSLSRANSNTSEGAAQSDSDVDEDDDLAPLHRSLALIKKKSVAAQVRNAMRAGSPLSDVLSSEKAYAAFYLESPRSALHIHTSTKDRSFKAKEKNEKAGNRKGKALLTPMQVAKEEQRLKSEIAKNNVHKDVQHKEQELLDQERHVLRIKAELALLKKQAEADAALKAREEALRKVDLMFANIEIAIRA
jgi:hypothetical protein